MKFAQVLSPSKPYQALKELKENKTERKNLFNVKLVSSCYFFLLFVTPSMTIDALLFIFTTLPLNQIAFQMAVQKLE